MFIHKVIALLSELRSYITLNYIIEIGEKITIAKNRKCKKLKVKELKR